MNIESVILSYIKNHPGTSTKKILSFFHTHEITNELLVMEKEPSKASLFRKLRILRKKGSIHSTGDSWYFMNRKKTMN